MRYFVLIATALFALQLNGALGSLSDISPKQLVEFGDFSQDGDVSDQSTDRNDFEGEEDEIVVSFALPVSLYSQQSDCQDKPRFSDLYLDPEQLPPIKI